MKIFSYCTECRRHAIWMEKPEVKGIRQKLYEWEGSGMMDGRCPTCKTNTKQRLKAIPDGTLAVDNS